jgi:flagellar M-ring protein FliF
VQGIVEFIKTLGAPRLAAMAAVTVALIGFFGFLMLRVTATQYTPLFTDLTLEDSSSIIKELERQGIAFEMKNDGAILMVPRDKVARLRMKLAEGGLPKGGGIGNEIFDKTDALGQTSFVQNINKLRALEGELARTIGALDRVKSARVHLVMPEKPLFARDKIEPSASIVLKVRGALENQQVRAIRHLVASAVQGLKAERISIVDETGRLLADGAAADGGMSAGGDERQLNLERRLRDQVEQLVSSVVGVGRARVQLTADFDFNRITQTSDKFDPEGRVLRSSQSREESAATLDNKEGQVTVNNELPNAGANTSGAQARDQSKKSEETLNYEISRVTKTEVIEGGRVNRLSIAVLVDGTYTKNEKGESTYQPRTKEEIDRIAALVRSSVGFDQRRGDQVEVVNLRFADGQNIALPELTGWQAMLQFTKEDIMRGVELMVMGLLGIIVLLLVVRPLVRRMITADKPEPASALTNTTSTLPPELRAALDAVNPEDIKAMPNHTSKMIDMAQVQGQVHAESVKKVGALADQNPQETISIIRQWLHEGTE